MKKALICVVTAGALMGCASYYDYYTGGVRYTQDGADCIYYVGENGKHFSNEIGSLDTSKRIVYRNTMCSDLYARDMFGAAPRADRQILVPVTTATYATTSCGCDHGCTMAKPIAKNKYVFVPAK